ncbi:MAG: polysaccharide biosynthesis C-terminal domain-containing protein, partial [bacterium]|nr:polysaccharide biosynthesis C-terminal domain-containing protein [bacterium]
DTSVVVLKVIATLFLLLIARLDLISVITVYSVTTFAGFLIGLFFIKPGYLFTKTELSLAKVLFVFGVWVAVARIANAISGRLDTLMLIRYVHPDEVGFYAAAQRMTFLFPVLVNGMTVVISPKFAALKTRGEAFNFFKKSFLLISLLFAPIVLLFFLAPWVTILIYGSSYSSSIYIFRWLLVSSFFFVATSIPVAAILYFLGQSRFFAILSLVQLVIIFLANLIFIPHFGVVGPAISLAISYGIVFIISIFVLFLKLKND